MGTYETDELLLCNDCGIEIVPGVERGFTSGTETQLCYDCAERRGGSWDEKREVWAIAPDLIGLHRPDREVR